MVRGGHRFIVQPDEFAVEQLVELQVKGQGNRYRYEFVKTVPGSDGDLCRAFEVDEGRCEPVDLGWGLFYELKVDYDDVADSWEFRMITDNLKQLLSGIWQVESVPNGVEGIRNASVIVVYDNSPCATFLLATIHSEFEVQVHTVKLSQKA